MKMKTARRWNEIQTFKHTMLKEKTEPLNKTIHD